MNAAVWFGGAVFFTVAAAPALFSDDMKHLLGASNYAYFSGAAVQILLSRYFCFQTVCGVIALLHLLIERLYLGHSARKLAVGLAAGLLALALVGGNWLEPRLSNLHTIHYTRNAPQTERDSAARSFHAWHLVSEALTVLTIGGVAVFLWSLVNPRDMTRFVPSVKFRG